MQEQKQGPIINIASVAGFKVFASGDVYSATKSPGVR
jgi:NADP-dependent 3-hydroxy acid dehydrogenase YdfG